MLIRRFNESRQRLFQIAAVSAFLLFVSITTSWAQTTTFASFSQRGSLRNISFANNSTSGALGTVAPGFSVRFFYEDPVASTLPLALQVQQNATLTITSTTNNTGTQSGGNTIQPVNGLTILAFRRDSDNANLLTVEIASTTVGLSASGAYPAQGPSSSTSEISGSTGGNSATYNSSTPAQTIRFTSDFLDFTQTNIRSSQLGVTGFDVPLTLNANGFLNSFFAQATGSFGTNPVPFYNPPTSSEVNISGRILTADGRGISRAQVTMIDASGATRIATSNSFGYYNLDGVQAGQTVVVSVFNKRYSFMTRVVSVSSDLTNLDFIAQ